MITLQEFIAAVVDPDYTSATWTVKRDMEADEQEEERRRNFMPYLDKVPASLAKQPWVVEQFIDELQKKIVERTKRPQDQYREGNVPCHSLQPAPRTPHAPNHPGHALWGVWGVHCNTSVHCL